VIIENPVVREKNNIMKQLIEDYKRRLDTINQMIENFKSNGSINDIRKDERLKTKAAEFQRWNVSLVLTENFKSQLSLKSQCSSGTCQEI
jgi:hypothetical protein